MKIGNITSGAEYWMDEKFQNLSIFEIFILFQIKNSENMLIFQAVKFWKFVPVSIRKIS